ncbi:hypothetical protein STEG23_015143, partial [Scotinomys teguina]
TQQHSHPLLKTDETFHSRKVVVLIKLYIKMDLELEWAHPFSKLKLIAKRKD